MGMRYQGGDRRLAEAPKGELAQSNAQLVARAARIARELDKQPATSAEARQILGLPTR